jgi:AcrR family transcriptional regulator
MNPGESPALASAKTRRRKPDVRIRRTHERLGRSLIELIQEKPMESVTVQEVLDRAGVGRATFYAHFRDKDDLLLSQLEVFLEMMSTSLSAKNEASRRVVPVAELFEHIGEQHRIYRALVEAGRLHDFFDLAQGYFARGIERRLRELNRPVAVPPGQLPVHAAAAAGSLLALLRWWLDRKSKPSPAEMDTLFHRTVWNGLMP